MSAPASSLSGVSGFSLLRLLDLEFIPSVGLAPPLLGALMLAEDLIVEELLDELVAELASGPEAGGLQSWSNHFG